MVYCLCYCTLEYPNCQGQVAIVTGGNKGIGLETVRGLCSADVTVIMGMYSFSQKQVYNLFVPEVHKACEQCVSCAWS